MRLRSRIVDSLPTRLWKPGNLYMPFNHRPIGYVPESWTIADHRLYVCGADGMRTVEWDGPEIAGGSRTFVPPDG